MKMILPGYVNCVIIGRIIIYLLVSLMLVFNINVNTLVILEGK